MRFINQPQTLKAIKVLFLILLIYTVSGGNASQEFLTRTVHGAAQKGVIIICYSRLGTTRTIAREMARNIRCEIEEIISNENRHGLWTVNCVFDQLFDWDDEVVLLYRDVTEYNPVIIAGPIWIHRFATPLCTMLKKLDLRGKDVYVLVTNQGNYSEKDEKNVRDSLKERGADIRGYASIMTRNKTENELKRETLTVIEDVYKIFPNLKPQAAK